jgi:hypothetical protein
MKKVIKHQSELFAQEVTLTVSERMNKLKSKNLAPKKLEETNAFLRKAKIVLPQ